MSKSVIVIGVGRMGQAHVKAAQSLGLKIVALVDRDAVKLRAAKDLLGLDDEVLFTDLDVALALKSDVAMIATTAPAHADLTIACARAGIKKILCEKPMAQSLAQCDQMILECNKTGAELAINHQMRFMDQYTLVKSRLDSEDFGGLSSMSVIAGCFGLAMNGTHYIEAFRYLTDGDAPKSVSAWFSPTDLPNPRGPDFRDKAGEIRVETVSGKRFYLEAANDQGHGMTVTYAAPYGHIMVDELGGEMNVAYRQAEHRAMPMTRYGMPVNREKLSWAAPDNVGPTAAVLQALLNGKNYTTGAEARQALAVLVAAYHSNENGHVPVAVEGLKSNEVFPWA
ncbi:MAG TPA: Gfo/Idh/MocA family oxidoreductase [Alphaproteobacteria bacterium]